MIIFSETDDDLENNILKTIYRKSYRSIGSGSTDSFINCNNATDPRYIYVVRSTALNRPSNPTTEFQMFVLQSIWNDGGLFQFGISPGCEFIVLRRYGTSWNAWHKVSLVSAN